MLSRAQKLDPQIDRAPIYRTLSLLKHAGLISEIDLLHPEGNEHYYELGKRAGGTHIGCAQCGRIVELGRRTRRR